MKYVTLTILLSFYALFTVAQNTHEWEQYLIAYGEQEEIDASSWEESYDLLYFLEDNPININTASREDLEQLPFLTTKQVEAIQEYIYSHGAMKTVGELAFLKAIDYNQRQLLQIFTYAGETEKPLFPKLSNIQKYGKHNLLATAKIPFYRREGDKNGYQGYQYKHSLRYDFTYGDYVRLGFIGSQDAGEPFFAGKNKLGYDFYSFYLVLKKLGKIKTLAIGRYRLKFGLGLVINNNNSYGKLSALTWMQSMGSNIRAHASRSENNYMQGVATTVNVVKGLDISAFASWRNFDATLNNDGTIATILTSGYHRTAKELEKKNNSQNTTAGGNITYRNKGFHIGATAVYTSLNRELKPNTKTVYRRHYASGKDFYNASIDYGYTGHRISFNGETATGGCNALATLNMMTLSVTDRLDITALQRFYSYKYYALLSRSFSEGGTIQNESGAYLGFTWRPSLKLSVTAYTDYAYFSWPKYQTSKESKAFDNLVQATWAPSSWTFTARYKLKFRERDNADKTGLKYKIEHRGRFNATYKTKSWQMRTQADLSLCSYLGNSHGWMLTQNLACSAINKLRLNASIGYFNTDDYDSRVYTYERGLLYSFSVPSFYGEGIRSTFLASTDVIRNLLLTAKVGFVKYFDRSTIGSSYQLIAHSSATDLEIQARWKF